MPAVVLLYHRIAALQVDPWGLSVTPEHMTEHLQALSRIGTFVPVSHLRAHASAPGLHIAISFDDGYADNLHAGLPLLERFDAPATFFIATDLVGREQEFWWDELEQLTLCAEHLPERFVADDGFTIELGPSDADVPASDGPWAWRAWHRVVSARQRLFLYLWTACRTLSPESQRVFLDKIRRWAHGESGVRVRPSHLPMSGDELARLAASPLVTIGAHTRTHPRLSAWSGEIQRREIEGSREYLRRLGHEVSCFAYPFGGRSDYSPESMDEVRRAGFAIGCAGWPGLVERDANPYELPRLPLQDCDADQALRQVHGLMRIR
jgi:peptidoglycan/xylan/chitin deacetylase (PgdA/CDA1 family)